MARRTVHVAAVLFSMTLATSAAALPVPANLNSWIGLDQPYGGSSPFVSPGNWVVDVSGSIVVQTVNGRPTFFVSPDDVTNHRLTVSFSTPLLDNDVFGVALGAVSDPSDPLTDYLLIDWRQSDQTIDFMGTGPVVGTAGLAVSRVTGVANLNELWSHTDSVSDTAGAVVELARGATLGSVGWADGTTYSFVIEYTTTSLEVWVDGALELSIVGDFAVGPMALYDFSQAEMGMSGITFEPLNASPEVVGGGAPDVTVLEGDLGFTSGAFTDADDDPLTLTCSGVCPGFADNLDGSWSWGQTLPEGPDSFTVNVTASDGVSDPVTDSFDVTVLNVAPVITATSGVTSAHDMGESLQVSADFTDAGVLDTHTATFAWDDGTVGTGAITESAGSGTAFGSHLYTEPGFYTLSVTVVDDDGASDTAVLGEVFVFDPDTFVTGGGWIRSPAGTWVDQPDHAGKTTFGFVVRYGRDGALRGNFEVQVHKGLNLKATGFDYLLINDGVAVFEGAAKVNGMSGYSFKVVAVDERHASTLADGFEVTVWHGGGVVYDTSSGIDIVGLGIQVHDR